MDQAQLDVVHAFVPPWTRLHYCAPTPEAAPAFQAQYRDSLAGRLQKIVGDNCAENECPVIHTQLIECINAADGIIEHAKASEADLTVVGNRGKSAIRQIFLGAVAEQMIRRATCSVLAVMPLGFTFRMD